MPDDPAQPSPSPQCDHKRGVPRSRSSAVTICRCCRDFLCSITALATDVYRKATGEVVESHDATTAIGRRTASLFRGWLQAQLVTDQERA